MPRHLLGVAVAAALAATTLTSCSGSGSDALEIWIRQAPGSDSAKTAQKLADAFTKSTGVKTKVVALFDDFETKLQQQAAQKNLPDIVINDTAQLGNMQTQGWIQEIDKSKLKGADQLSDVAWKAAQAANGKYYGAPFSSQSFAILERKDWREKLGMPVPQTWDDLAALAKAFTEKDPDGNGAADTAGWVMPAGTKRGYAMWYSSSYVYANGGDFVTDMGGGKFKPAVNTPQFVQAIQYLQDQFCKGKTVNPGAVSNDTTISHEVFEKGQGGIYLTGPYVLARFEKNIGPGKVEVIPLPKGPSGGPGTLGEGENVYLMAGSDRTDDQRKFAEYAISAAGQQVGMNGDAPGAIVRLPINTTVDMASQRKDPGWKVFQDQYQYAKYSAPVPNWAPIRQTSADAINAVYADCSANVQTAMDGLSAKLSDVLKQQNASAA
ncbi:sugar ABC transporter substrate-binding protein [Streptosporangiaceae bacterium NEAU-GS5]|nr:sugar ABC transporter substrate-binding protein [Streptosporangiaceae bacterium NEAU-GS5]